MARVWGVFSVGALLFFPATALAQSEPAPAAPVPAPAPKADKTVVVILDAFDDETENAKLRAKIYQVARERGLTPDGKADVRGAAEQKDAMQAGHVSTEAGPLENVRQALGAAVLIRISKDPDGVRVLVVRNGDAKSKVIAGADAATEAVAELLGGGDKAKSAGPAATATADPAPPSQGISAGFILKRPKKDDEPDYGDSKVLSAAWQKRGGARVSYGAHAQATGLIIPKTQYLGQNPETGEIELGKKTTYGVGLGLGLDLSVMYLPLPEPASGSTSWAAFRAGLRFDLSGLYVRPPLKYSYKTDAGAVTARDTKYDNIAYLYGVLPMELGVNFGFGDFRLPTLWRGVVLGIAYAPSFIFSLKVGAKEDATSSDFNYAGFELSADITKLEVSGGSQPQIRLSALVLPRVKNDLPWLASFGVGAVWY
ncbi:MAG: hypothetical protein IPI67_30995 [Myxococcales bacterium]|nr:hypothetical protein [Myxococcales bacterium]